MNIKSAQYSRNIDGIVNYIKITTNDDTIIYVPIHTANKDYVEIQKQVTDGTLTIADAE
tara:strand:+ start:349 stop:525 length:177 start_codon:yes stop_codon:yes gene_type:complete